MRSARPKPLHLLCGQPMVVYVLEALSQVKPDWAVMVVGHGAERVVKTLDDAAPVQLPLHYVEQTIQRGTGDAVSIALASLPEQVSDEAENADILILPGDTPLLEPETVAELMQHHYSTNAAATMLTVKPEDPTGYGRVLRDKQGRVRRVVEQRDADEEELQINEVNTSVYCFRTSLLGTALRRITPANAQGELYLTDAIEVLATAGHRIETVVAPDVGWAVGVNDREQLSLAEAELRRRINDRWMQMGVTMVDPANTYVDCEVELAEDVALQPGTRLKGSTVVAKGCEIGPNTVLTSCNVGEGARVVCSHAELANIGAGAKVGPFAVLEPGAEVGENDVVAPFTTVKETEG